MCLCANCPVNLFLKVFGKSVTGNQFLIINLGIPVGGLFPIFSIYPLYLKSEIHNNEKGSGT